MRAEREPSGVFQEPTLAVYTRRSMGRPRRLSLAVILVVLSVAVVTPRGAFARLVEPQHCGAVYVPVVRHRANVAVSGEVVGNPCPAARTIVKAAFHAIRTRPSNGTYPAGPYWTVRGWLCFALQNGSEVSCDRGPENVTGLAQLRATLATFAGTWVGHTRILTISAKGFAKEHINAGCCDPVLDLWFRFSHVHGPASNAFATVRVTQVHVLDPTAYAPGYGPPHVGERRTLHLNKQGVITEPLTQTTYCDPAGEATGACGA
jgi:hypothetical protein